MFLIGIDLGTTHCALAYIKADDPEGKIDDFAIPQLVQPGEISSRKALPSCLYLSAEGELPVSATTLPWGESHLKITGEWARRLGAHVPMRRVSSAKSWLCHPGVDRMAALLPWGSPDGVTKISPVDASANYLIHLRNSWNHAHPEAPLPAQPVVVTLPASFDESARALTVTAIRRAGFEHFTLLEEPQAAFYSFTAHHRSNLSKALEKINWVLVIDVGGGTTDFTLIRVASSPEGPVMSRLAVGDHLMLGGDNMDAALAHQIEAKGRGNRLSTQQWTQALDASRTVKESLLGPSPPSLGRVILPSSGSRLTAVSIEFSSQEIASLILDGFFPFVSADDVPKKSPRGALQELGLPYAGDPAITRHIARFLSQHAETLIKELNLPTTGKVFPRPDALLLNGGVFNSPQIVDRLQAAVSSWWADAPPIPVLDNDSLELAVARGAAYYGWVRQGRGQRISGGTARSFYLGIQNVSGPKSAICLIPRGTEEGDTQNLSDRSLSLALGKPVQFPLYSSSADRIDRPGEIVPVAEDFAVLPPVHALLKSASPSTALTASTEVHLEAKLTELGTLELWCVRTGGERWRLDFELRGNQRNARAIAVESMPVRFGEAALAVDKVFGSKPLPVGPRDVKQLVRSLEATLGPRERWRLPILRELWSTLMAGAAKRRRSEDHERQFFSLLGFTLRPGFGYPLDDWRAEESFRLFREGVQFHSEKSNWNEFWILWRRVSGGLSEEAQDAVAAYTWPCLERGFAPSNPGKALSKLKGVQPQGFDEMVRAAASLEHLAVAKKIQLGDWIVEHLKSAPSSFGAWGLGRLGARSLIYGSNHKTVPASIAQGWIDVLLGAGLGRLDGASFAVLQLAKMTGDRLRDLEAPARRRAVEALRKIRAPEAWLAGILEVVEATSSEESRALGDTLPEGLTLGSF